MLQVKDNQRNLYKEIIAFFHKAYREAPRELEAGYYEEIGKAHGRIEERYYRLLPVSDWMAEIEKWQDIQSVVEVTRKRTFRNYLYYELLLNSQPSTVIFANIYTHISESTHAQKFVVQSKNQAINLSF